jgi:hypothetical protein
LIEDGKLLVCSDGAYNPKIGSASHAWIFASEIQPNISSGSGPDDGHPAYLSSYRSELGGILAAIYIIFRICLHYNNITSGTAKLYCDNKGAVTQSRKPHPLGITPFLTSDYDFLGAFRDILSIMPIKFVCEWVKGHHSGNNRGIHHDLNDQADKLASQHLATHPILIAPNDCLLRTLTIQLECFTMDWLSHLNYILH